LKNQAAQQVGNVSATSRGIEKEAGDTTKSMAAGMKSMGMKK
jgi:hypothetical protein